MAKIGRNAATHHDTFEFMYFPAFEELGLPEILTCIAVFAFLLETINCFLNFFPASRLRGVHTAEASRLPPVSVVICARNEEENLQEFLPRIMEQEYPDFEVVVVNDCSFDNTGHVIDAMAKKYPRLRKAEIKEDAYYKHGKKFAMLVGIKSAKHPHIVFTDADCYPASPLWLKNMAAGFTDEKEIVLGYGAYEKQQGFLNTLIRFDTFIIAAQFLSAAIRRKAYMGVGRNLAYTSTLFFKHKGFANHYHLQSGDDDLFVNNAATRQNVNVCISPDAVTYSRPKTTFKAWQMQKARHLTTAPHYNSKTKTRLTLNLFSQYFYLLATIALAFSMQTLLLIPAMLLLKTILLYVTLGKLARKLGERDLLAGSLFYWLILLFIYPIFQAGKLFYKPARWNR